MRHDPEWQDLLLRLAAADVRAVEAEEQREAAEKLVALARDFLMATAKLNEVNERTRGGGHGGGFVERAQAQRDCSELFRRASTGFGDAAGVGRDYVNVDDVAELVESAEARRAIHREGQRGLPRIAELIRRREFRRFRD